MIHMIISKKNILLGTGILIASLSLHAQDTTIKRTVDITSTFKPVLRDAAKINFNATPPTTDEAKPTLQYSIPNQNLLLSFQPGSLKPLALQQDSVGAWDNSNFVKVGFGSFSTPFVQTGFSFSDGKTVGLNINAKHVSSSGKLKYQDFSDTKIGLDGFLRSDNNLEWRAGISTHQEKMNRYGYLPASLVLPKDSVKQNFQTYAAKVSMQNMLPTEFALTYRPELSINVFNDDKSNSESNTVLNLPLHKTVGKVFAVDLAATFDLTNYKPQNSAAITNTLYYISPSLHFKTPNILIEAGIRPSWDNKNFKMFPNVLAEISSTDQRFTFQAGWTGYLRKTSYQYLASQNPWLKAPSFLMNTSVEERYAGFKGTVGDHVNYSAKVGFNKYGNQPLFVNNFGDGRNFMVVNESEMKVLHFDATIGVTQQEKFSLIAGIKYNQFSDLKDNAKAWGMLPLELNGTMSIQVLKDMWFKSDVFMWSGPQIKTFPGNSAKLSGTVDLNAGLEFRVTKSLNLWLQTNNIFNNEYQRWNQYNVYGFNFVGGIVYSFAQKN
jgi:hypothetical protein